MMAFKQQLIVLFTACLLFTARAQEIPRAEVSNNLPSLTIDEGSDFEVCVMLDAEPTTEVRVNIRTIESPTSAREDADYSSVDRTLTFIPPSADRQCVTISILDDNAIESFEFFTVSVTSSDVTFGGSHSLTPVIIDTTVPNFEFVQSSYTVTEDDEDTSDDVCVTAINTVFEDATGLSSIIEISAVGGSATADEDFAFLTEFRTFLPSTPEGRLCFSPGIRDDDIAEDLESYTLSFTSTIFTNVNGTTTIYIPDDDGVSITFAQADYSVDEVNAGMSSSVNVCLSITPPSGGLDRNVVVTLNTEEDTADSDEPDFEPLNVQLTFTDSLTTLCQLVNIIGEEITEEDELFFVVGTLQNNLDMFVGPDRVTITIRDDLDGCPSLNDPENGEVQVTGTAIDSTATYTCNEGFELSEEAMDGQTCVRAVGWSPDLDERICNSGCPSLNDPENGEVQVTGTAIGSTATYTCNEGFELLKEAMDGQTCVRAVGWSPDLDERICNSASSVVFSGLILLIAIVMAVVVF